MKPSILRNACFCFLIPSGVFALPSAVVPESPAFIPLPAEMQIAHDVPGFAMGDALPVHATDAAAKEISAAFALSNLKSSRAANAKGALSAVLDPSKHATLGTEGYSLVVTSTGIALTAAEPAGLFHGATTLAQAVVKDAAGKPAIPALTITDMPRIAWRGFMLDVSRHFFDKNEVMATLDQMATLKLNVFHWHLTDDHGWRIEIKKYPKLTTIGAWHPVGPTEKGSKHIKDGLYGGFYTQDEIREVVAYAAARHIRVVPEIDMPAHMSAAAASYPELSPTNGWTPIVATQGGPGRCAPLCVARPQTVKFCKDVLEEVLSLFPSKEIHIGGDEVFYDQWKSCPDMMALKEKMGPGTSWEDVQIAFTNDISKFLAERGRTTVCWNNIYKQTVDKSVINHFWRNMGNARDFANGGYDVLMSPYVYYFDHAFSLKDAYNYDPLNIGIKPDIQGRLRGIEGCAWTERVSTIARLQTTIYPRLIAIAESGWTPQEKKDWASFEKRVVLSPLFPKTAGNGPKPAAKPVFHSALTSSPGAKPAAVPAGNLASWKSARFLTPDEEREVKPAAGGQEDIRALDGNPASFAMGGNHGQGWIYDVDLETTPRVRQVKLSFNPGKTVTALQVRVSTDGIVWNTVYDKTPRDRSPLVVDFNPAEIRFIRIVQPVPMMKEEKENHFMGIVELEAY